MFHQMEGLVVDVGITPVRFRRHYVGPLCAGFVWPGVPKTRLRPSYFPFTGSVWRLTCCFEIATAVSPLRKRLHSGWIEVLGAGVLCTAALENCGIYLEWNK